MREKHNKDDVKRKFFAMRIDPELLQRVERVAEKNRTNPRIVIEQCLDAHLKEMEANTLTRSGPDGDKCSDSSVIEHHTDTVGVAGLNPARCTISRDDIENAVASAAAKAIHNAADNATHGTVGRVRGKQKVQHYGNMQQHAESPRRILCEGDAGNAGSKARRKSP